MFKDFPPSIKGYYFFSILHKEKQIWNSYPCFKTGKLGVTDKKGYWLVPKAVISNIFLGERLLSWKI